VKEREGEKCKGLRGGRGGGGRKRLKL